MRAIIWTSKYFYYLKQLTNRKNEFYDSENINRIDINHFCCVFYEPYWLWQKKKKKKTKLVKSSNMTQFYYYYYIFCWSFLDFIARPKNNNKDNSYYGYVHQLYWQWLSRNRKAVSISQELKTGIVFLIGITHNSDRLTASACCQTFVVFILSRIGSASYRL